jgi:hypothetical protein
MKLFFPGVPYSWDATIAVAEAYAAGTPLNIALYTAAEPMHTSKYLHSSEAGDFAIMKRVPRSLSPGARR